MSDHWEDAWRYAMMLEKREKRERDRGRAGWPYAIICTDCGEQFRQLADGSWECPVCDAPQEPEERE